MFRSLSQPFRLANILLPHRVVMAPMTRSRSAQPGNVPTELMAEYYAQRASSALIVTEATQISPQGQGYSFTPGIHSEEQVAGWKKVTDRVHQAGGRIFVQLWHVGRMSHSSFHDDGQPVAPSALAPDASVWVADPQTGLGSMVPCPVPRALDAAEIPQIVEQYRMAARNAMHAGFDGVEIHGANGYLIDQFLRTTSNRRTDHYGGSKENRVRFLLEVAQAVGDEIGFDRVGVRVSPFITQRGMNDPAIIDTLLHAAHALDELGIVYLHLAEADWDDAPQIPMQFREELRASFRGSVIVAGGYTAQKGEQLLETGLVDLIAFGRPFISNPDLPQRLFDDLPLAPLGDKSTLFGGGAAGYTDYSSLSKKVAS